MPKIWLILLFVFLLNCGSAIGSSNVIFGCAGEAQDEKGKFTFTISMFQRDSSIDAIPVKIERSERSPLLYRAYYRVYNRDPYLPLTPSPLFSCTSAPHGEKSGYRQNIQVFPGFIHVVQSEPGATMPPAQYTILPQP